MRLTVSEDVTRPIRAMVEAWDRGPGNTVRWHLYEDLDEALVFERGAIAAGEQRYLHHVGGGWTFHPKVEPR